MAKKYFRTIKTHGVDDDVCAREHTEKLNNYIRYGWAASDADTMKDLLAAREGYDKGYEIEIHHQNTTSWMRGHTTNIMTVLCCSDEYEPKEEEKEEY